MAVTGQSGSKLLDLELIKFSGNHAEFSNFWDVFYALVDSKPMANVQKLVHLRACLPGDATQVYAGFKLTGEMYDPIVQRLKIKYGSRRILTNMLIRKVLFKSGVSKPAQARGLLDYFSAAIRQLEGEQLSFKDPTANRLILAMFETKIPESLLRRWELHLEKMEEAESAKFAAIPRHQVCIPLSMDVTLADFLAFCETHTKADESTALTYSGDYRKPKEGNSNSNSGNKDKSDQKRKDKSEGNKSSGSTPEKKTYAAAVSGKEKRKKRPGTFDAQKKDKARWGLSVSNENQEDDEDEEPQVNAATPQKKKDSRPQLKHYTSGCVWCGASHHPKSCQKLSQLPFQERWDRIRQRVKDGGQEICFVCFGEHKAPDCTASPCGVKGCQKRHNKMLHRDSA